MNNEKFWKIINKYKDIESNDIKNNKIIEELLNYSDKDIFEFEDIKNDYLSNLYNNDLWNLLSKISKKYIGDDCFEDFMAWVITQGKEVTEDIINNLDLRKYIKLNSSCQNFVNEEFLYTSRNTYNLKHNITDKDNDEFDKKYIEFMEQ